MAKRKLSSDVVVLVPSAARTVTAGTNGDAVWGWDRLRSLNVTLDVTAAATDNADKLDVYIQTTADGTNWFDIYRFTQCDGDGGAKRYSFRIGPVTNIYAGGAVGDLAEVDHANNPLSEKQAKPYLGLQFRARWVITDANANGGFTFSVTACPEG